MPSLGGSGYSTVARLNTINDHKLSHSDFVHTILYIFGFQEGDGHLHIVHHKASCHDWGLLRMWHCGICNQPDQPCTRTVWTQFVLSPLPRSPEMRRALQRLHSESEQIQQSPPGMTGMTLVATFFRSMLVISPYMIELNAKICVYLIVIMYHLLWGSTRTTSLQGTWTTATGWRLEEDYYRGWEGSYSLGWGHIWYATYKEEGYVNHYNVKYPWTADGNSPNKLQKPMAILYYGM